MNPIQNPMAGDDKVLTLKEGTELLRVRPSTIYNIAREGRIRSLRIGSDWRFRKDRIVRWLAVGGLGEGFSDARPVTHHVRGFRRQPARNGFVR